MGGEMHNPRLRATILRVVEDQLRSNDPPETGQAFARLVQEGHSKDDAKRLIACVVANEIFQVMKRKEPFNRQRFTQGLAQLPEMPWEQAAEGRDVPAPSA
jgi:hypothetical protein